MLDLLLASAASIALAETSGRDAASVRVAPFDANGNALATTTQRLARYGSTRIDNVTASRIEIAIDAGGGSVIGLATIANAAGEAGATVLSQPVTATTGVAVVFRAFVERSFPYDTASVTTVVPILGKSTSSGLGAVVHHVARLHRRGGRRFQGHVPRRRLVRHERRKDRDGRRRGYEVLQRCPEGPLRRHAGGGDRVRAGAAGRQGGGALLSSTSPGATPSPSAFLTLPTNLGEALTSASGAARRPLYYDGLEQSTDPSRGSRWMLVLNEVSGSTGFVNVKLYEAANRTSPIADKDLSIKAFQQVTLDTVFAALGLDAPDRRKDRTNVQVVVTATVGSATIAATAVAIDNASGDTKTFQLVPTIGSGTPNISFTAPVLNQPTASPPRHRAAKH